MHVLVQLTFSWKMCVTALSSITLYMTYMLLVAEVCSSKILVVVRLTYYVRIRVVGASLSEPHTGQTASPAIYDLCMIYPEIINTT